MNIGEISERTGIHAKMIRYYEEQGIIPKAKRSPKGYRIYDAEDERLLHFVHRTKSLGFTLDETKELLLMWRNPKRSSARVKRLVAEHLNKLEAKIQELSALRALLKDLHHSCQNDQNPECSILDALATGENLS